MDLKEFAALEFEELKCLKALYDAESSESEQKRYIDKQMAIKWEYFILKGIDVDEIIELLPAKTIIQNWDELAETQEKAAHLLDLIIEKDPDWIRFSDKKLWVEERKMDVNKLYPHWKKSLIESHNGELVYLNLSYLKENGLTEIKTEDIKKYGKSELLTYVCREPKKWKELDIDAEQLYPELIRSRYFDIMLNGPVLAMRDVMDFDTFLENIDIKHFLRYQIEKDGKDKIYFKKFMNDYIEEKGTIEGLAEMVVEKLDGYRNPHDNVVLYELFVNGGQRVMDAKKLALLCSYKEHGEPAEKQAYRNLTNQIPIKKIRDTFSIYVSQKKLKEYFPKI